MRKNIFAALATVMIVATSVPVFAGSMTSTLISEAKAKQIALQHAGVEEKDASFARIAIDYDDGLQEYDVKFYVGNEEYDYDIDARTGEIRSMDREIEAIPGMTPAAAQPAAQTAAPAQTQVKKSFTKDDALQIAMEHTGVKASDVSFSTVHKDYDDGRETYDVEFYVGYMKYSYEIDAASGRILDFDIDYDD